MSDRLVRLAPLTGVVFALLSGVTFAITPSSPSAHANGAKVIAFYEDHRSVERVSVLIGVFALGFFMFFATALRGYLRRTRSVEGLGALVLAAAVLLTLGLAVSGGFAFALADAPDRLTPAAAQTLNLLDEDVFFAMPLGIGLFGIASGLAILRGAPLPNWLAWVAIVLGVVAFTPLFGLALVAVSLWVLVASILIFRRSAGHEGEARTAV